MTKKTRQQINELAQKAADLFNALSDDEKAEVEEEGLSTIFEKADCFLYLDIINSSDEANDALIDLFYELIE